MPSISIATYNSWAIDHAERVSVALQKQELLRQLRDAEAVWPRPSRRRRWLYGFYARG